MIAPFRRRAFEHLIGDAPALAISDGLLLAVEAQAQLLAHVAGRGPAHQRLDPAGRLRLKIEHPVLGIGLAGLHGGLGRLVDARGHGGTPVIVRIPINSPIGVLQISAYTLTLQAGGDRSTMRQRSADRQRRSAGAQVNFGSKTKCGRSVDVSWTTTACDGLLISREINRDYSPRTAQLTVVGFAGERGLRLLWHEWP